MLEIVLLSQAAADGILQHFKQFFINTFFDLKNLVVYVPQDEQVILIWLEMRLARKIES